jgi:hypothetical protein
VDRPKERVSVSIDLLHVQTKDKSVRISLRLDIEQTSDATDLTLKSNNAMDRTIRREGDDLNVHESTKREHAWWYKAAKYCADFSHRLAAFEPPPSVPFKSFVFERVSRHCSSYCSLCISASHRSNCGIVSEPATAGIAWLCRSKAQFSPDPAVLIQIKTEDAKSYRKTYYFINSKCFFRSPLVDIVLLVQITLQLWIAHRHIRDCTVATTKRNSLQTFVGIFCIA